MWKQEHRLHARERGEDDRANGQADDPLEAARLVRARRGKRREGGDAGVRDGDRRPARPRALP